MGIIFILFFELIDIYSKKEAKQIILKIIKKIEYKNTKLSDNYNKIYPFILEKYEIWKLEKKNWINEYDKVIKKQINNSILSSDNIKKISSLQDGGFYFKSLESKGEKPLTGADLTSLLDEIQGFFYNAKYTEEGNWLREPDVLISLLRGDTEAFKFHLNYAILPKYYQIFPPFIKWDAVKKAFSNKKYEDYPDYLLAYLSYMKSKNAWEVEQGIAKPENYDASPFAAFANASDRMMTGIAKARRKILHPSQHHVVVGIGNGTYIG